MIFKRLLILFITIMSLWGNCNAQSRKFHNTEELSAELDSFIKKEFYVNPNEEVKAVFTVKIDSTGEIHSAHIRWSLNLKSEEYYRICYQLESKYAVKFIHDKYKHKFPDEKYVICDYPYFSNRENSGK